MRDNQYLVNRLNFIWQNYFSDIRQKEPVSISFGRRARYRFGSIRYSYRNKNVQIAINGRFRSTRYPAKVIDHTIAHELVHYAQGFPTPGPRLHRYPHRGGVVDKELKMRHLIHLVIFYNKWVKGYVGRI